MSDKTVRELAEVVGIPLERFLEQLKEAGLSASAPDDVITEDEKVKLLTHLRKRHGKTDADQEAATPKRITLKRSTKTELRQSSAPGSGTKTVSVEVRKQKTYIKRSEAIVTDEQKEAERAKQALAALEEQKRKKEAEEEKRRQHEAQLKVEAEAKKAAAEKEEPVVEAPEPIEAENKPAEESPTPTPATVEEKVVEVEEPAKPVEPELTEEERLELEKKLRLEAQSRRSKTANAA